MATYDIRKQQEEEITEIQFDTSNNRIAHSKSCGDGMVFADANKYRENIYLVDYKDIDNLIAALKKAKELWG